MSIRIRVKADSVSALTGATYITDGASLGGEDIFAGKSGNILNYKGLVAGANITLTPDADTITISSTGGGGTGITSGVTEQEFNAYTASTEQRLSGIEEDIVYISGKTDSKLSINSFNAYSAATHLIAGSNITLTPGVGGITISSTGGGGGSGTTGNYVSASTFNQYTGTTAPATYVSKTAYNIYTGDTLTALNARVLKTVFSTYTGTTAPATYQSKSSIVTLTGTTLPATYASKTAFNAFTGTTAPATYQSKSSIVTLTGTTLPATYALKSVFNGYTGTTAPATYQSKSSIVTLTGTTLPATYQSKSSIVTLTGTTLPATYAPIRPTIVTLSTTTVLDATYNGKIIEASGTITITLPNSMSAGYQVTIINVGTGVITVAASTTLNTLDSRTKLSFRYASAYFYHSGSNIYNGFGNLTS